MMALTQNMASWKCGVYVVLGALVIVLILLLNFDYLPKRKLSEELELSTKSSFKGFVSPSDGLTTRTTSRVTSAVEKDSPENIPVSQYMQNVMNWSCSEDHSKLDNLPELTFDDVKNVTWNCSGYPQTPEAMEENFTKSMCYQYDAPFKCVRDPIHCHKGDESSDKRFLRRPQYGEYKYLPKSLWLNVVLVHIILAPISKVSTAVYSWFTYIFLLDAALFRHGGVAFLYHPCARQDLIEKVRTMAVSCLQRHVITPYERLSPCKPIAMIAWSCFYSTSHVNISDAKRWIQQNAMKGPASHVSENGQYTDGLITPAGTVSDKLDTHLCPEKIKSMLPTLQEERSHLQEQQYDSPDRPRVENARVETISIQNSEQVLIVNEQVSTNRKVDPSNAAWALGSVIFLCLVLGGVLIYTRPWKHRDYWWRVEDYNSNTKFSFMKTRGLRFKPRTFSRKKPSGYSRLLTAIPEEFEDDI